MDKSNQFKVLYFYFSKSEPLVNVAIFPTRHLAEHCAFKWYIKQDLSLLPGVDIIDIETGITTSIFVS